MGAIGSQQHSPDRRARCTRRTRARAAPRSMPGTICRLVPAEQRERRSLGGVQVAHDLRRVCLEPATLI